MKATIHFAGEPAAGIRDTYFEGEFPDFNESKWPDDREEREFTRSQIQELYSTLMGGVKCHCIFEDEYKDDEPQQTCQCGCVIPTDGIRCPECEG
jgi:hypothetical protein